MTILPPRTHVRRLTAAGTGGAVAVFEVREDLDVFFAAASIRPVAVGHVALRNLFDVDRGLVVRWSEDVAWLMPHAGRGVDEGMREGFVRYGVRETVVAVAPSEAFAEASSEIEAAMLATLAVAASPDAIDLLLRQPAAWSDPKAGEFSASEACQLARLIDPPMVVLVGASNIGKSTLVNALAKRHVSVVADEPGTTRDHVGVEIECGGLVVKLVDTPGRREGATAEERAAAEIAMQFVQSADLLLIAADARGAGPDAALAALGEGRPALRVALRTDLGADLGPATWEADVSTSAASGAGLEVLVGAIREALSPACLLGERRRWRFWDRP